jgi:hypothetical protein
LVNDDMNDDEPIELLWDDLRISRHRKPPEEDPSAALRALAGPGDLVIGTSSKRLLAVIKANGQIEFGPEYRPDEAAMVFWRALARQRYQQEEQTLISRHMESILAQIGSADIQLETLRRASQEGDPEAAQRAIAAHLRLERLVHQAIELGRGLARRPEIPIPEVPERIPDRIRENPQSAYEGRAGVETPETDD